MSETNDICYKRYDVKSCDNCVFVNGRSRGSHTWNCQLAEGIGAHGRPPKTIHARCPLYENILCTQINQ